MKALIVIPAYSHIDPRVERAIRASELPVLPAYEHSDLPRIRSVLIETALGFGAERLILLDADTVPGDGVLRSLAEADGVTPECAVWGMYPLREGDRWSVNPEEPADADAAISEGRSFRILTGGLGLCVIHRESLLRVAGGLPTIIEDSGTRWRPFCVPFVRNVGPQLDSLPPFQRAEYYADDGSLCLRLREAGTELWCDPRLRAGHIVRQVLTGLPG